MPLAGYKQTPEHIARRVASIAETRVRWSPERDALYRERVSSSAKARPASAYRNTPLFRKGQTPWNKGNNWRDTVSLDEFRAIIARSARVRRARMPGLRLHARMSALVRHSLKGRKGGRAWEAIVGYSRETLMQHLEAQFAEGMTWGNMGKWHIDHIIPRAAFRFEQETDGGFGACWALSNLQPLWAKDNLLKGAKTPAGAGNKPPVPAIQPQALNPLRRR